MFLLQVIITCWLAGMATWRLHHHLQRGPVLASAVVTLVAGLVLPATFENGHVLAAVAACGSYVGMSANIRLSTTLEISAALVLASVLFAVSANIFMGVGGRLGTIAAISAMTVWGCSQLLKQGALARGVVARIMLRVFR